MDEAKRNEEILAPEPKRRGRPPKEEHDEIPRSEAQQSSAAKARWAGEKADEDGIRKFFGKECSTEEGLAILARMRKNAEIAGEVLNTRITTSPDPDRCAMCGQGKPLNKQWCLVQPYTDDTTLRPRNRYFCSIYCISCWNKKQGGTFGIVDQGMTRDMNPDNHPSVSGPANRVK